MSIEIRSNQTDMSAKTHIDDISTKLFANITSGTVDTIIMTGFMT